MKKAHVALGVIVVGLLAVGIVNGQQLVLRVVGIKPFFPERRVYGWVAKGADPALMDKALRAIHDPDGDGPGSWVYEFGEIGASHEALGLAHLLRNGPDAVEHYRLAALYYGIARFPYVDSPAKAEAYRRHIDSYLTAARAYDPPVQVVPIPFEGEQIIGYLRVPGSDAPPPVVVLTGGVDTWKSDDDASANTMLAEGMATFAFDMPGTGESAWPLTPDSDRIYAQVLEYLKSRPDVDGNRMAVYLRSFAGHFAVKLALTNPDVKAAVNVGGPIHLSFRPEHTKTVPIEMVYTVAHAMHEDPEQPFDQMVEKISRYSLDQQGLLHKPEHQAPLLSINGDQDALVTIEDLYIISKRGIAQEEWVYEGDGHCATYNTPDHLPKSAAWIKARLAEVPDPATEVAATF